MKKIYLLLAFITFTINAQKLPEKFQGYWIDPVAKCDSYSGINVSATNTSLYPDSTDFNKIIKINENSYKVIFDTVDYGEIRLILNLKDNILEIKEQRVYEDGEEDDKVIMEYKLCK
jgi:hypothetical protein